MDPSRNWDEHLQHMLIFCKVHVLRNFRKKFPKHKAQGLIQDYLWNVDSLAELYDGMDSICRAHPKLTSWVCSKKKDWIAAGLCLEASKIPPNQWILAHKHTGIGESSHFEDNNIAGRRNTLLGACLK